MDIEWRLLLPLLAVLALTILVTGPGLWSDKWGYWWVNRDRRSGGRARARGRHRGGRDGVAR
jgi:hypothetical protein